MTSSQPTDLLELARRVSQNVKIKGILLSGAGSNGGRHQFDDDKPLPKTEHGFHVQFEKTSDSSLLVKVFFMFLEAKDSPADDSGTRMTVNADFSLLYEVASLEKFSEEQLSAFARMNGAFNAWPYWREYLQSTLTRMGLPPLTLPVLTAQMLAPIYREAPPNAERPEG